jgi:hypothetical protein
MRKKGKLNFDWMCAIVYQELSWSREMKLMLFTLGLPFFRFSLNSLSKSTVVILEAQSRTSRLEQSIHSEVKRNYLKMDRLVVPAILIVFHPNLRSKSEC